MSIETRISESTKENARSWGVRAFHYAMTAVTTSPVLYCLYRGYALGSGIENWGPSNAVNIDTPLRLLIAGTVAKYLESATSNTLGPTRMDEIMDEINNPLAYPFVTATAMIFAPIIGMTIGGLLK
jgi:hypothetical protein